MARINWLHHHTGSRVSLAALILVAVATAIGAANAVTPDASISSSATSDSDGVWIVTLAADGTPTLDMYCSQVGVDYNVRPGGLNADGSMKIGTVHSMSSSGCSALGLTPVEISLINAWRVSATTPLTGGEGTTRLDEIAVTAETSSGGCSLSVRGSIDAQLNLNEKSLTADPESADLTVSEVVGCFGLVADGDKATVEGEFVLL